MAIRSLIGLPFVFAALTTSVGVARLVVGSLALLVKLVYEATKLAAKS